MRAPADPHCPPDRPDLFEARHEAAERRLAQEVDDMVGYLNPTVRSYPDPTPVAPAAPIVKVRPPKGKKDKGHPATERAMLIRASVDWRHPVRRYFAKRTLRRRHAELFPEDHR